MNLECRLEEMAQSSEAGQFINKLNSEPQDSETLRPTLVDVRAIIEDACTAETEEARILREKTEALQRFRISVNDEFPEEACLLAVDDVSFFAKGDIHAIKAKQKQGKTHAIAIMTAAILCGQWGRINALQDDARVLIIDTEQKASDTQRVYKRTLQLAGLADEDIYERFCTYSLRSQTREEKLDALEVLIKSFQPDIVFVDGLVDLIGNFNDVDESKCIIDKLARLSTEEVSGKSVAIVCVLHENKSSEDHNMRGHLGTMLSQKVGTALGVKKDKGIFMVSDADSRHKELPAWSFKFDDNDSIVAADSDREAMLELKRKTKQEEHEAKIAEVKAQRVNALVKVVNSFSGGIKRKQLTDILMKELRLGNSAVSDFVKKSLSEGIIVKNEYDNIVLPESK